MQPIERTAAVTERMGREVSATTYGSSWYKIPHVARDVQAPFLGPRGTGGSELLKIRHAARGVSPAISSFSLSLHLSLGSTRRLSHAWCTSVHCHHPAATSRPGCV